VQHRVCTTAARGFITVGTHDQWHCLCWREARKLEAFQLQRDEGPCLDCYQTGAPVNVADLNAEKRRAPWFTVVAEQGVASVHASPLRLRR